MIVRRSVAERLTRHQAHAALRAWALCGLLSAAACSPAAPDPPLLALQIVEGTVDVAAGFAEVVTFQVDEETIGGPSGWLSGQVDWTSPENTVHFAVFRRACTASQVAQREEPCRRDDAATWIEDDGRKPLNVSTSILAGETTLAFLNFGPETDSFSYRLEVAELPDFGPGL